MTDAPRFSRRGTTAEVEGGLRLQPRFDADGLIPAIVTDAASGEVLMLAYMNAEAASVTPLSVVPVSVSRKLTTRPALSWTSKVSMSPWISAF